MKYEFPDGVWPVMLTPYTEKNTVDYHALEKLVEWYAGQGADGLFAVCQSSEMFFLSLEERVRIAAFVKKISPIPVIVSGHIGDSKEEQARELNLMAETGADALILITNRLAKAQEGDTVFLKNLERLLGELPEEIPLGFYECPYPYKRLLSKKVTEYARDTGRFYFIKDTSCDTEHMKEKLAIISGSNLKLYNANTVTLLDTLKAGASGYSGIMANFHSGLYKWLCRNFEKEPEKAAELQNILTMCSLIEHSNYPVNAKYAMKLLGNEFTENSRKPGAVPMSFAQREEVRQLLELSENLSLSFPTA